MFYKTGLLSRGFTIERGLTFQYLRYSTGCGGILTGKFLSPYAIWIKEFSLQPILSQNFLPKISGKSEISANFFFRGTVSDHHCHIGIILWSPGTNWFFDKFDVNDLYFKLHQKGKLFIKSFKFLFKMSDLRLFKSCWWLFLPLFVNFQAAEENFFDGRLKLL